MWLLLFHDALVIDFDLADRELFNEVQEIFSVTRFGKFSCQQEYRKRFWFYERGYISWIKF